MPHRTLVRCAFAFLWVLLEVTPVRAQDWLLSLPACGHPPEASQLQWVYPRVGLPAVVTAGAELTMRVRLPVALTPPPGRQQAPALREWAATLQAELPALRDGRPFALRYPLRVLRVRPDGPRSLVYRVSVATPAWAAPGSYALWLRAPGGESTQTEAVRLLAPDTVPKLAQSPGGVDVWVASHSNSASHPGFDAPVRLQPRGLAAALRVGPDLHVLGSCPGAAGFEREVEALAADHGLRLRTGLLQPQPQPSPQLASAGEGPLPTPGQLADPPQPSSSRVRFGPDAWVAEVDPRAGPVSLVLAGVPRVRVRGARAHFYLGTSPGRAGAVRVLRLLPTAAEHVRVQPLGTSGAAPKPRLRIGSLPGRSRRPLELAVEGAVAGAKVAWELDGAAYFGATHITHAFDRVGPHWVRASVLGPDGSHLALQQQVWVDADRPRGCGAAGGVPPRAILPWLGLALLVWAFGGRRLRRPAWGRDRSRL